jgi:hypothetical protein
VFSMMYGASGVAATPLGLVLNANTAMTVISGEHASFAPVPMVQACPVLWSTADASLWPYPFQHVVTLLLICMLCA